MPVAKLTQSAAGASAVFQIPLEPSVWQAVPGISLLLNFSGGGPAVATATVQVSNDPNVGGTPQQQAAAVWNAHDVLNNVTADMNSSIAYPVRWVRLNLGSYTSGTVTLGIGYPENT